MHFIIVVILVALFGERNYNLLAQAREAQACDSEVSLVLPQAEAVHPLALTAHKLHQVLHRHHSKDPTLLAAIRKEMSATKKEPWRRAWCWRPNKALALRCGTCDVMWHRCIGSTIHMSMERGPKASQRRERVRTDGKKKTISGEVSQEAGISLRGPLRGRKHREEMEARRIASKRTFLFLRQILVGTPIRQATHQRRERHLLRQRNNFTDLYVP